MFEFVVCGPGMYFGDIPIPTSYHLSQCVFGMPRRPSGEMMEGHVCQVVTNPDVVSVIKYQGQNEYGTMADLIMW